MCEAVNGETSQTGCRGVHKVVTQVVNESHQDSRRSVPDHSHDAPIATPSSVKRHRKSLASINTCALNSKISESAYETS